MGPSAESRQRSDVDGSVEPAELLEGYATAITVLLQRSDLGCFLAADAGSDAPIVDADGTVLGRLGGHRTGELGIRWWKRRSPP